MTKASFQEKYLKLIWHQKLCCTSFTSYSSSVSRYYSEGGTEKLSDLLRLTHLLSLADKDETGLRASQG